MPKIRKGTPVFFIHYATGTRMSDYVTATRSGGTEVCVGGAWRDVEDVVPEHGATAAALRALTDRHEARVAQRRAAVDRAFREDLQRFDDLRAMVPEPYLREVETWLDGTRPLTTLTTGHRAVFSASMVMDPAPTWNGAPRADTIRWNSSPGRATPEQAEAFALALLRMAAEARQAQETQRAAATPNYD